MLNTSTLTQVRSNISLIVSIAKKALICYLFAICWKTLGFYPAVFIAALFFLPSLPILCFSGLMIGIPLSLYMFSSDVMAKQSDSFIDSLKFAIANDERNPCTRAAMKIITLGCATEESRLIISLSAYSCYSSRLHLDKRIYCYGDINFQNCYDQLSGETKAMIDDASTLSFCNKLSASIDELTVEQRPLTDAIYVCVSNSFAGKTGDSSSNDGALEHIILKVLVFVLTLIVKFLFSSAGVAAYLILAAALSAPFVAKQLKNHDLSSEASARIRFCGHVFIVILFVIFAIGGKGCLIPILMACAFIVFIILVCAEEIYQEIFQDFFAVLHIPHNAGHASGATNQRIMYSDNMTNRPGEEAKEGELARVSILISEFDSGAVLVFPLHLKTPQDPRI